MDIIERQVGRGDLPIWAGRPPIEGKRESVWRPKLSECKRSPQGGVDADPAGLNAIGCQSLAEEATVAIIAHCREHRGRDTQSRKSCTDIATEATDESTERLDVLKGRP
jgi:hypothetical protein